jgi:uncharacterized membrane protein (DUF2068 family)
VTAAIFGALGIFMAVLFVRAITEREIRSGVFTYGAMCVATALGLWRIKRWGRNLAIIVVMGNIGLGTLTLLAVLMSRRGPVIGPVVLLVVSLAMSYWLSRPAFDLSDE